MDIRQPFQIIQKIIPLLDTPAVQVDRQGNVNVSMLGGVPVGPGGFIDIAQNARRVVFCGTFDAKGARATAGDGRLTIHAHGAVQKLVAEVDQVTFSGPRALRACAW